MPSRAETWGVCVVGEECGSGNIAWRRRSINSRITNLHALVTFRLQSAFHQSHSIAMVKHFTRSLLLATAACYGVLIEAQIVRNSYFGNASLGALDAEFVSTITVNRFGSVCHAATKSPFPPVSSLGTETTTNTPSHSTAAPRPATSTQCSNPVCPHLDRAACLDINGQAYGITCNAVLTGPIMYPAAATGKLRPRTYASTFTECLAICDREGGGCHGVSWSRSNCLLYGAVVGVRSHHNGSVAATRIVLA